MYRIYLGVGALMYLTIVEFGSSKPLFICCALVILSFYGGGFATIPAYLQDLFGTYQVGAIHGRLLTAWSTARRPRPADRQLGGGRGRAGGPQRVRPVHDIADDHDRTTDRRLRRQ